MRGSTRTGVLVACVLALGGSSLAPAREGAPTTTAAPAAPEQTISAVDASARVEAVRSQLAELRRAGAPTPEVVRIEQQLPVALERLTAQARDDHAVIEAGVDLVRVQTIADRWADDDRLLAGWDELLGRRATELQGLVTRADALESLWTRTQKELSHAQVPAELAARIGDAVRAIRTTRGELVARRDHVLTLRNRTAQQRAIAADVLAAVDAERKRQLTGLRVRNDAPLWAIWSGHEVSPAGDRLRAVLAAEGGALHDFVGTDHPALATALAVLVGLLVACLALARRARRWASDDPSLARARLVIDRPISAAFVLWIVTLPWLNAPMAVRRMLVPLIALPFFRLMGPLVGAAAAVPAATAVVGLLAIDRVRDLLTAVPEVSRPLLLLELGLGIAALHWLRGLLAAGELSSHETSRRWLDRTAWVAQRVMAVGAAASVLGYTRLGELLGVGTLRSAWAATLLWVLLRVLDGIVVVALRAWPLSALNLVRRYQTLAARRARRLVRVALVASWVVIVLRIFHLWEIVTAAVVHLLGARLVVGQLSLSLGGVLVFAGIIWGSFLLSRGVRAVLDEEVFSRVDLPRGMPYALATMSGYLVLFVGFVAALGAAGIDFSRITIVLGALGVGVGLGLQGIVNDVVSGTILLFERPIRPGDLVQNGDLLGEVRRIGLRSSTIRSIDGADMIVPNSSLTANQIINWTLSDRRRRIDLPVGVAYGSDPRRVIDVLVEAARRQPAILEDPEPVALFMAFGDSALEFQLRAWTDAIEDFFGVRSLLAVAVNDALAEAGLSVPFPQRDLHLRSVDADVLARTK